MKFSVYKLHFTSPLHISDNHNDGGVSLRTIQSDTLYAALTHCLAVMKGSVTKDCDFPFLVSSLFPYYCKDSDKRNKDDVFFMPMPLQTKMPELSDPGLAKKIKKVKWIDARIYSRMLKGDFRLDDSREFLDLIYGEYLSETELQKDVDGGYEFIRSEVVQRAAVPNRFGEGAARPFYMDRITFSGNSGLFFLALGETDLLDEAMDLLKEEGIGSDRNVGMGYFYYEKDELKIDIPEQADYITNLSVFIPESKPQLTELIDSPEVAYDFARRGGWISTDPTIRKNVIYGFLPGSVFRKLHDFNIFPEGLGKIVDLRPEIGPLSPNHPVWRNGKAIMLPLKLS